MRMQGGTQLLIQTMKMKCSDLNTTLKSFINMILPTDVTEISSQLVMGLSRVCPTTSTLNLGL